MNRLAEAHIILMWCFSFNSLHSLAWLTASKRIALLRPFSFEHLFARQRCYGIVIFNWIAGAALASTTFEKGAILSRISCTYKFPTETNLCIETQLYHLRNRHRRSGLRRRLFYRENINRGRSHAQGHRATSSIHRRQCGKHRICESEGLHSAKNVIIISVVAMFSTFHFVSTGLVQQPGSDRRIQLRRHMKLQL